MVCPVRGCGQRTSHGDKMCEMTNEKSPMQQTPETLLLPSEAAAHLRIHPETFRRWLREGRIKKPMKVGRGWRIPLSELTRLEAESTLSV